jgi:hypothetical protein
MPEDGWTLLVLKVLCVFHNAPRWSPCPSGLAASPCSTSQVKKKQLARLSFSAST